MKLNDKIFYYRKAAKLSQEELAARVGVSRQAVSKWELGEAAPDTGKLLALARALGITADHLLDDEAEPGAESPAAPVSEVPPPPEDRPGFWERMIRRWGWLAGVYVALTGVGTALTGGIARYVFNQMFRLPLNQLIGESWESGMGAAAAPEFTFYVMSDVGKVFVTVATVVMAVGVFIAVAGVVLALVLFLRGRHGG